MNSFKKSVQKSDSKVGKLEKAKGYGTTNDEFRRVAPPCCKKTIAGIEITELGRCSEE